MAYIIVSASTPGKALDERETLEAIADAMGVTPEYLERVSVPLIGAWDGQREHSRAIYVGLRPWSVHTWREIHSLAYRLREALGQDAVMVLAERYGRITEVNVREVFENVERVSIALPTAREAERESLSTSTQTGGEPIIPGVQNGTRWTCRGDEHGDHLMALV